MVDMESGATGAYVPSIVEEEPRQGPANVTNQYQE